MLIACRMVSAILSVICSINSPNEGLRQRNPEVHDRLFSHAKFFFDTVAFLGNSSASYNYNFIIKYLIKKDNFLLKNRLSYLLPVTSGICQW